MEPFWIPSPLHNQSPAFVCGHWWDKTWQTGSKTKKGEKNVYVKTLTKYRGKSYRFEMYLNGKVNFWWCAEPHNLSSFIRTICYLNLKEEPLVNKTGLGLGLGSSNRRKKAWYSTQIFQNTLQQSLLPIMNSRVSWQLLCYREQRHFVLFFLLKHLN